MKPIFKQYSYSLGAPRESLLETVGSILDERLSESVVYNNEYYLNEFFTEMKEIMRNTTEMIKRKIEEVFQQLIQFIDQFVIQEGYYLTKYMDRIIDSGNPDMNKIMLHTYDYRELDKYPKKISKVMDGSELLRSNDTIDKKKFTVEKQLMSDFSYIYGGSYKSLPLNYVTDFKTRLRGSSRDVSFSPKVLEEVCDYLNNYKKLKKDLKAEKIEIIQMINMYSMRLESSYNIVRSNNTAITDTGKLAGATTIVSKVSNEEMYEAYMVLAKYYNDLTNIIQNLYLAKLSLYGEKNGSYREFARQCIIKAGITERLRKDIKVVIDAKDMQFAMSRLKNTKDNV